jgi:hypothetical protein
MPSVFSVLPTHGSSSAMRPLSAYSRSTRLSIWMMSAALRPAAVVLTLS